MTYQIEPKSDIMSLERIVGRKVEKGILELVSKSADPERAAGQLSPGPWQGHWNGHPTAETRFMG